MFVFLIIVGLLMAGSGGFMCYFCGSRTRNCTVPVDGIVTKCTTSGRGRMAGIYFPVVSYSVGGVEYIHTCNGSGVNYPIGETLPLLYNPADPQKCYAVKDGLAHRFTGPIIIIVGIGFMALAFFVP